MSEHTDQEALFQIIRLHQERYPDLALIFSIPNGGFRPPRTAARMRDEGQKPGVPDVFVPVPMYHSWWGDNSASQLCGLFIELKVGKNQLTPEQRDLIHELGKKGYATAVCRGWEEAWQTILAYLKIKL